VEKYDFEKHFLGEIARKTIQLNPTTKKHKLGIKFKIVSSIFSWNDADF
jgi:hypothetical protein